MRVILGPTAIRNTKRVVYDESGDVPRMKIVVDLGAGMEADALLPEALIWPLLADRGVRYAETVAKNVFAAEGVEWDQVTTPDGRVTYWFRRGA